MLGKLAFRNVKRQMGSYLIYFITVALTVALMFAVNNVLFSDLILARAADMSSLRVGLVFGTVVVSLIVGFVISYATSYMLKLRKREFGAYLTLGMERKDILKLFLLETLLIGAASLLVGIVLGLLVYQGLMLMVCKLMEMDAGFSGYSFKGLLLTVGIVALMFMVSSLFSALYLKRVKIYDLLHGDRYVTKKAAHPVFWGIVALLMLGGVAACISVFIYITELARISEAAGYYIFYDLAALVAGVFLFSFAAAKSVTGILLKSKRFKAKGTNTFVLRQLSAKLNTNAVMFGVLALLMTVAVIASNFSFALKANEDQYVQKNYPFDATATFDRDREHPISAEQAESEIEAVTDILYRHTMTIYEGDSELFDMSDMAKRFSALGSVKDRYIRESDFNELRRALGREPLHLDGGYAVVSDIPEISRTTAYAGHVLTRGGVRMEHRGTFGESFGFTEYLYAVVPDAVAEMMEPSAEFRAYRFSGDDFDGLALAGSLRYETPSMNNGSFYSVSDYSFKKAVWEQSVTNSAVWIVASIYIAFVLIFISMAVLGLKALSDIADNRRRYDVLYKLGLGIGGQSKALFAQIFIFFFIPFVLPLLICVPTVLVCAYMLSSMGFGTGIVYLNGAILGGVFLLIYLCYMLAAYAVSRNGVIKGFALK